MSLREQLQEIYDEHGKLTPELVVQTARSPKHPLHAQVFDKSPGQAAEAWYRFRAHELIRSVRVVYREADETNGEESVRFFHAVRAKDDEFVYEPVNVIAESEFLRTMVLRDMEREWKALHRRYNHFAEFIAMVSGDLEVAAG